VAWSQDGTDIAPSGLGPDLLDVMLQAKGKEPALCVVRVIPDDARLGEEHGSVA
jgi:hypothetical protein